MLVNDILIKVLQIMEKHDIIASMKAGDVLVNEQLEEVSVYINCLNNVRNEIATEYIPNVKIEKVKTQNGRVDYSSLSKNVIEILSVKDSLGDKLTFDAFDDYLLVSASEVEITYNASPEEVTYNDKFSSTIPERVYAYGVIREFYFIQALYEDASIWEARFKNSLQALERKKTETVIPRRRWL